MVGEVTRGVTARDEYERVARDIRYAFYREASAVVGVVEYEYEHIYICMYVCVCAWVF